MIEKTDIDMTVYFQISNVNLFLFAEFDKIGGKRSKF